MIAAALVAITLSSRLPVASDQYSPGKREPATGNSVQLRSVTYDQWLNELASMRGHIVVVDLWATWCAPCVARFPRMIEMANRWRSKGVTFVSLSLDDRNEPGSFAHVLEFLTDHDARIPNYMMNEVLPDAFDKLNLNAVPAVLIYDAGGKQRYRLTGDNPNHQFTDTDVEAAVKTLVAHRR